MSLGPVIPVTILTRCTKATVLAAPLPTGRFHGGFVSVRAHCRAVLGASNARTGMPDNSLLRRSIVRGGERDGFSVVAAPRLGNGYPGNSHRMSPTAVAQDQDERESFIVETLVDAFSDLMTAD